MGTDPRPTTKRYRSGSHMSSWRQLEAARAGMAGLHDGGPLMRVERQPARGQSAAASPRWSRHHDCRGIEISWSSLAAASPRWLRHHLLRCTVCRASGGCGGRLPRLGCLVEHRCARRAVSGGRLGPGSRGANLDGLGEADGVAEDVGAGQAADRAAVRRRLLLQRQARRGGGGKGMGVEIAGSQSQRDAGRDDLAR